MNLQNPVETERTNNSSSSVGDAAACKWKKWDGLVHAVDAIGHRGPYVRVISGLLSMDQLIGPLDWTNNVKLMTTRRLFLSTFDDAPLRYASIAMARGLLGRPTAALFIRPQTCVEPSRLKLRIKRYLYRLFLKIPRFHLITITPFVWHPKFSELAHHGTYDPQYWDFFDGKQLRKPSHSQLSRDIQHRACGRAIVCLPGFLSREKGFEFYSQIVKMNVGLCDKVLFVAAGAVLPGLEESARSFQAGGGLLIERQLDDFEIESLYVASDAIWACYSPEYDQASGIFGRALQLGLPVFVRRASMIERIAGSVDAYAVSLDFGDPRWAGSRIEEWLRQQAIGSTREGLVACVAEWRRHFQQTASEALRDSSAD